MKPLSRSDALALTAIALIVGVGMALWRPATLFNDSFQYMSVAANLLHGRGVATSIPYFDTERSHGVIPAPMTTFPPGYPIIIAALSATGMQDVAATRVISTACFALLFPL